MDETVADSAADGSPREVAWPDAPPLDFAYDPPVRKRRVGLPVTLFVLTCLSTFWTGSVHGEILPSGETVPVVDWSTGALYMLCVMSILLAHELGHFFTALYYRVPASLPYFIPMPLLPLGTMGAVIGMKGSEADRKQLFDIGLAGPIAGLVLAVPIAWYGVATAVPYHGAEPPLLMHNPWFFDLLAARLHPELPADQIYQSNPFYLAGWLGMLITGLNMMPVSQLDGGHVAYAVFGRWSRHLARALVVGVLIAVTWYGQTQWVMMLFILFMIGIDHPPTRNDRARIGVARRIIGIIALLIPIFCLAPTPISVAMP